MFLDGISKLEGAFCDEPVMKKVNYPKSRNQCKTKQLV